jgi:Ca2+-binding EF-hand superfamily protein
VDRKKLEEMFSNYDGDKDGGLTLDELEALLVSLGVAPMKDPMKGRGSASADRPRSSGIEN